MLHNQNRRAIAVLERDIPANQSDVARLQPGFVWLGHVQFGRIRFETWLLQRIRTIVMI